MFYPALTRFSCADCQRFVYDVDWSNNCAGSGDRKTFCGGTKEFVRPASSPPPCGQCPKGSPAEEHEHVLSAENWKTYQIYREMKATGGASLTEAMRADRLLMGNLALVDSLASVKERRDLGQEVAYAILKSRA